jgi:hypothetical protein
MKTEGDFAAFVPLPQLQLMRRLGRTAHEKAERCLADFRLAAGDRNVTFRFGVDFVEGNDRLRWTPAGIDKLLAAGLWKREFDSRGNLRSKPVTPETAMRLPGMQLLT